MKIDFSCDSFYDDYDRDDDLEDTSSNGGEENDDESGSEEEGNDRVPQQFFKGTHYKKVLKKQ